MVGQAVSPDATEITQVMPKALIARWGRPFGLVCRVVMCIQGVKVLYGPLMTGTIRLSKGVRREAESEESR